MMLLKVLLSMLTVAVGVLSERYVRQADPQYDDTTFQTQPRRALVKPGGTIILEGYAGVPLQSCLFHLPEARSKWPIDFSLGLASNSTDRYEYFGRGLEFGECGIRMKRVANDDDGIIQCRVLPVGSDGPDDWQECVTTLRVTNIPESELPVFQLEPNQNVIQLSRGEHLTIKCNADRPINLCHVYLPGPIFLNLDKGVNSTATSEYRYHGNGLDKGECGATLTGVDERLTGYVVCKVGSWPESLNGKWETASFRAVTRESWIVHKPPIPTLRNPNATSCPPLISDSVTIRCQYAGKRTDCSKPQKILATAHMDCKIGYAKPNRITYKKITCLRGGIWDPPQVECQPDCGKRITNLGVTQIANGSNSRVGEFPWHVGIYQLVDKVPTQICGGSLIRPGLVVSVAHCFWDNAQLVKFSESQFRVGAGKQLRLWDENNAKVQRRRVLELILPDQYRGRGTNFNADIALLRLDRPFKITAFVNLICVEWNPNFGHKQLQVGSEGVVAGWGFTETGAQSDVLQYLELPYRPRETCLAALRDSVQPLLTEDKFCAGFINGGKSVCGGDSGGGLVFREPNKAKHYLRGLVSIAFIPKEEGICNTEDYTGFTDFNEYLEWVQNHINYDYSKLKRNVTIDDRIVFPKI